MGVGDLKGTLARVGVLVWVGLGVLVGGILLFALLNITGK